MDRTMSMQKMPKVWLLKVATALIVSLVTVLIPSGVSAQVPTYTIRSEVDGLTGEEFDLTIWNGETRAVSKLGIPLVDEQIFYRDTTSIPLVIRITVRDEQLVKRAGSRGTYPVKSQHMWLVAMPGATITLRGHLSDFSEIYPYGDRENDILREFTQRYYPLLNDAVNISVELARIDHGLGEAEINTRKQEQKNINQKASEILLTFLDEHPSSIAGLYFMGDSYIRDYLDTDKLASLVKRVDSAYQQTIFYQSLKHRVAADAYQVGKKIFEIKSDRTPDGTHFNTAQWKGQFYLIDFWGSWCSPCIADFPYLKELKRKFPDRLQVLGIASDREEAWRPAIQRHELDWQHILIGSGDQDFATRLNVTGYPTKILVDPEGIIVYRSSGGGEKSFLEMSKLISDDGQSTTHHQRIIK